MTSKKILILSSCFYPNISPRSFRTTELAKELARRGHDVTVYISKEDYDYDKISKDYGITIKDYGKLRLKKISYSGGKIEFWIRRAVNRILLQFIQYPEIEFLFKVLKVLKKEYAYDLLISIAVPHPIHWGVALFGKKIKRITSKWIADCGDPYMLCKTGQFKKMFYFSYLEKKFCKNADYITVPTNQAIEGYYPEFKNKIRVIPQGFDIDNIILFNGSYNNSIPTYAYAGSFIPNKRDPGELIEYLYSLTVDFHFIIYTNDHILLNKYLDKDSSKIEVRTYIPRDNLLYELSKMDFLVFFENNTYIQTPSKIIDYALTKKPILSVTTGALDVNSVNNFINGDYSKALKINNISDYNIINIVDKFLQL